MQKSTVRKIYFIGIILFLCGGLTGLLQAETYKLIGGQVITGDAVSFSERGVLIKLPDDSYSDRISWDKFSQEDLKKLAKNPKAAKFAEALIEPSEEEATAAKKEIVVKTDYAKLDRPAATSLLKALFSSGIGVLALLLIYAGNIYAGYEISIFRARAPLMVCGVSAVVPVLGPIIFLCMPTQVESKEDIVQEPARDKDTYHVGDMPPEGAEAEVGAVSEAELAASLLPATQTFPRGQFTFNRRFFETKFPGFFTLVRRDADKDMVLIFSTGRAKHVVQRITRVGAAELHLQVQRGSGSEEITVPFAEIQEVVLKHKDA